ncbi:MAG: pyruvate kinase [Spirochaetes bacterium]|nr:pyruvate kinase [Spirochaetota bacterium]
MRKTKIICTIGPATDDKKIMRELVLNGMNVARLNFSHGNHEEHKIRIDKIKKIRKELKTPVALLLDTKGPEIRTGNMQDGGAYLMAGNEVILTTDKVLGTDQIIPISYDGLPKDMGDNKIILIDDGLIQLKVKSIVGHEIHCQILNSGKVASRKGVNVPNARLSLPAVSKQDKADLLFGIEQEVDYVAASFIRKPEDVLEIRNLLDKNGGKEILIIAKIENQEGVENINEIIALADGLMVARGDLGVEVDFAQVPLIQKRIIIQCVAQSKPVIIATQMLDSMINNPRPTRAEVSDVANAIYDSTSAVMLSGETASGKYPVECLQIMAKTAETTERNIDYQNRFFARKFQFTNDITGAITNSTVTTAYNLNADAIIVVTKSGHTAQTISRLRPDIPIITTTPSEKVYHQLSLNWGIIPILSEKKASFEDLVQSAIRLSGDAGMVSDGDLAVITAGVPVGFSGTTNLIRIETVGDVLCRGKTSAPGKVFGRACICRTFQEGEFKLKDGDILITTHTDQKMMPLMKRASAIVIEDKDRHDHAQTVGMTLEIPVITEAYGVLEVVKDGTIISVDGEKGLIFTGKSAFK